MPSESASPDELYGLPLAEFVPARDALAASRRAAGDRDGAAAVKALRKPTLAAWAMNQTAREHPADVARLLEAGAALRAAQRDALAGDSTGLREAGRVLGDLLQHVTGLAAGRLDGSSPVQRDRIAATLRATATATATDGGAGDRLRRGVLVEDLDPAGFGLEGFEAPPASSPRRPASRSVDSEAWEEAGRALRRAEAEAEAAATVAQRRAERAEAAERRAMEAYLTAQAARAEAEERAAVAEAARRRAQEIAAHLAGLEETGSSG